MVWRGGKAPNFGPPEEKRPVGHSFVGLEKECEWHKGRHHRSLPLEETSRPHPGQKGRENPGLSGDVSAIKTIK